MRCRAARALTLGLTLLGFSTGRAAGDDLADLAREFWAWRVSTQPVSSIADDAGQERGRAGGLIGLYQI